MAVGMLTRPVPQSVPGFTVKAYGRGLRQSASTWHGHADIADTADVR